MDGITDAIPFCGEIEKYHQFSLFDFVTDDKSEKQRDEGAIKAYCRIYDWRSGRSLTYKSMKEGRKYEI